MIHARARNRSAPRGPVTRPPTAERDYVSLQDHWTWMGMPYIEDGRVVASSRAVPSEYPHIETGTWMIDDHRGLYGRNIYELVEFQPRDLTPTEFRWEDPKDDLRVGGRWADAERYATWLRRGWKPPPIMIVQHADGHLNVSNGHRRLAAADMVGAPIRGWVSWTVPTQGEIGVFPAGLTYEMVHGRSLNPKEPPLMRGHRIAPTFDPAGWYASEKLDGVRAYWDGQRLISRAGNVFAAPEWFTVNWPKAPLDGELFGGRGKFNETSGTVRRQRPNEGWRALVYFVFDLPAHAGTWLERQNALRLLVEASDSPYLVAVPHVQIQSKAQLAQALSHVERAGGEGLMLVDPQSRYQPTRTHSLLKVKSTQDDEGTVTGYEPSKTERGLTGSLWVKDKAGKDFKIGGLTMDLKRHAKRIIPIGTVVTYQFFERTPSGKPRFATFARRRDEEPPSQRRSA